MAVNVTSRGYKYRSLPENDTDTFEVFVNDDSKDNMIRLNDELNELNNKVTLDKVAQTNFDFIEGKVVQDGLEFSDIKTYDRTLFVPVNLPKSEHYIYFKCYTTDVSNGWFISDTNGRFRVGYGNGMFMAQVGAQLFKTKVTAKPNVEYTIMYSIHQNKVIFNCDGNEEIFDNTMGEINIGNVYMLGYWDGSSYAKGYIKTPFIYNRRLTSQEIQHNFSVLNNTPSISQLQTTDSTGKTSILKLGSNEDHVEMSTGRTLRQEYMGLLKRDGREFTADTSGKIDVQNGLEARVISTEIKGQTVNSCIKFLQDGSSFINKFNNFSLDPKSQYISGQTTDTSNKYQALKVSNMNLIPDTYYTLVIEVAEFTSGKMLVNNDFIASPFVGDVSQFITSTGIFKFKIKTKPTLDAINGLVMAFHSSYGVQVGSFKFRFCLLMGDITDAINIVRMPIPFGLSSTQTIISNNGMKYPFYATEEDKILGKVIELGGVGDVRDTLEIKEDGSGVYTQNTKEIVLNGSGDEDISLFSDSCGALVGYTKGILGYASSDLSKLYIDSNRFKGVPWNAISKINSIYLHPNGATYIMFDGTAKTLEEVLNDFKANPVILRGNLATPIITHIPKELVEPIATNQINILSVDSAVKPSSFKATVPTTGNISKAYDLTLINAYTGVTKANLLKSGDVELLLDVTIPSVFNQQVCSLPTELRPKVETTLLALNGNTPISITILPTGEVKCPTSIVGEIKLKDTYIV